MKTYTVDKCDDGTSNWACTERDEHGMPVDETHYPTRAKASRAAANRRYEAKTRRKVAEK